MQRPQLNQGQWPQWALGELARRRAFIDKSNISSSSAGNYRGTKLSKEKSRPNSSVDLCVPEGAVAVGQVAVLRPVPEVEDLDVLVGASRDEELAGGGHGPDGGAVGVVGEAGLQGPAACRRVVGQLVPGMVTIKFWSESPTFNE